MNLYYYLYYVIYKFLSFNATYETTDRVPSVCHYLLLVGLTNYYLSFLLTINLFKYINYNFPFFAIIFILPIPLLYFFNEKEIIKNHKYKKIIDSFDQKNKLKKLHFIILSVLYLLGSIIAMILAGLNYTG